MNILIFSLGPIFKSHVHGGSQKVLRDLALGLAERGHKINIVCIKRRDNFEPFQLHDNILVEPILPLKEVFPAPYFTSPFNILKTVQLINERLAINDVFYIHDAGLNVEFLKNKIPTVISLRDFYYPETLVGAINFNESVVIVNSDYTYDCLRDTFAAIKPGMMDRTVKIYNGFKTDFFIRKKPSQKLLEHLNISQIEQDKIYLGFPHRADDSKGIYESLTVLEQLVTTNPGARLLIPEYIDDALSAANRNYTESIKNFIDSKGLSKNVIFHKWIPHGLMPEYYSICKVILCIGDFLEAFSNVTIEALLCGTPVIAIDSVTYKTMPVQKYLLRFARGRFDLITNAVKAILDDNYKLPGNAREFLLDRFSMARFIDEYEHILMNSVIAEPLMITDISENSLRDDTFLRLTAWCHCANGHIYNEYSKELYQPFFSIELFSSNFLRYDVKTLLNRGFKIGELQKAIEDGVLIVDHKS